MDLRSKASSFFQNRNLKRVQYFFILAVFWCWITLELAVVIKTKAAFLALKPVLETKILLIALLYGGRYLFFPTIRWRSFFKWSLAPLFIVIWGVFLFHDGTWLGINFGTFLRLGDILVWSAVLGAALELVAGLFQKWQDAGLASPLQLRPYWEGLNQALIKLGFFMACELTILYHYLINLFVVDTLYYSYLAAIVYGGCGLALYAIWYTKVIKWADAAILEIDTATADFLQIDQLTVREILPWYQYLILTRNYLEKLKKPQLFTGYLLCYIACGVFLLIIPYLLGFAVPV